MIMYLQWAYIYLSVISLRAILRNMGRFHSFDHGQLTWTFKIQNKLIVRLCKIKISHQSTKIIHHTLDISVYKYFLVKKSLIQMSYVGYTNIRYKYFYWPCLVYLGGAATHRSIKPATSPPMRVRNSQS